MTILAFGAGEDERDRMKPILAIVRDLACVSDWSALRQPAVARMIVARDLTGDVLERVRRVREDDPVVPIVLVTSFDVRNLLNLAHVIVDEVADFDTSAEQSDRATLPRIQRITGSRHDD